MMMMFLPVRVKDHTTVCVAKEPDVLYVEDVASGCRPGNQGNWYILRNRDWDLVPKQYVWESINQPTTNQQQPILLLVKPTMTSGRPGHQCGLSVGAERPRFGRPGIISGWKYLTTCPPFERPGMSGWNYLKTCPPSLSLSPTWKTWISGRHGGHGLAAAWGGDSGNRAQSSLWVQR